MHFRNTPHHRWTCPFCLSCLPRLMNTFWADHLEQIMLAQMEQVSSDSFILWWLSCEAASKKKKKTKKRLSEMCGSQKHNSCVMLDCSCSEKGVKQFNFTKTVSRICAVTAGTRQKHFLLLSTPAALHFSGRFLETIWIAEIRIFTVYMSDWSCFMCRTQLCEPSFKPCWWQLSRGYCEVGSAVRDWLWSGSRKRLLLKV